MIDWMIDCLWESYTSLSLFTLLLGNLARPYNHLKDYVQLGEAITDEKEK